MIHGEDEKRGKEEEVMAGPGPWGNTQRGGGERVLCNPVNVK